MATHNARLAGLVLAVSGLLPLLIGACTIVRVDSDSDPARIESRGLIKGHAAAGIPAEDHLLHLDLFDGSSKGAIAELVVWKLFRFELGLAGASIGVGPFSLGLGIFFYDAKTPEMVSQKKKAEEAPAPDEPDEPDEPEANDEGVTEASAEAGAEAPPSD